MILLRHAKSAWDKPGVDDIDRPLAPRGRRATAAIGVYLRDEDLAPDLVLCSTALRARETWTGLAQILARPAKVQHESKLYLATPDTLFKRARAIDDGARTILFIGHEGGVDEFARQLAGDGDRALRKRLAERFPTAALAVIALTLAHWADLAPRAGALVRYVTPKELV